MKKKSYFFLAGYKKVFTFAARFAKQTSFKKSGVMKKRKNN